jgi:PII-like signaling protein
VGGRATERAADRVQRLQAEAASSFGVPLPAFVAPDLDLGIAKVSFSVPRVTLLAEQLASASWRLLGARTARARAIARAREQAAEATALRGVWGYHGDHQPHGDRLLSLRRKVPVLTVVVDTPARIRRWFAIIDELTDETGLVTCEMVPAFRTRGRRGDLRLSILPAGEGA